MSEYIPSFQRCWSVVEEDASGTETVKVENMVTGLAEQVTFSRRPAREAMRIKHLMSECSGIGYETFSDVDSAVYNGSLQTKRAYALVNALRRRLCPTIYSSACILGHPVDLAGFCDIVAEAGVLCTDPGTFSYGLGATVLGRVVEVVYERHMGQAKRLSDIFHELLFEPLGMSTAAFFDPSVQLSLPALYGVLAERETTAVVRAEESVPAGSLPYSNHRDHYSGPMSYDSGDTGALMTMADYGKFLDCLLSGGCSSNRVQVLPKDVVETLLRGRHEGLHFDTGVAKLMRLGDSEHNTAFHFGWAVQGKRAGEPHQNYWSGYAGTHARLYPDEKSFLLLGVQCMDHSSTGLLGKVLRDPLLKAFRRWRAGILQSSQG